MQLEWSNPPIAICQSFYPPVTFSLNSVVCVRKHAPKFSSSQVTVKCCIFVGSVMIWLPGKQIIQVQVNAISVLYKWMQHVKTTIIYSFSWSQNILQFYYFFKFYWILLNMVNIENWLSTLFFDTNPMLLFISIKVWLQKFTNHLWIIFISFWKSSE